MKLNKKKVVVVSLAISLVAILSLGTLAWFSDKDEVTNKFMIATSEDTDPDDIFSVDVWEKTPDEEKDQDGYEYKDVLPGDVLTKEVNVENTGYYDQYIRVTITISDAAAWMTALNTTTVPRLDRIFDGYDPNGGNWSQNPDEKPAVVNDNLVYTLYYRGILDGDDENNREGADVVNVFTAVKIPQSLTVEQAAAFKTNFEINVTAEAVQTENLGVSSSNSVMDAVEAFTAAGLLN